MQLMELTPAQMVRLWQRVAEGLEGPAQQLREAAEAAAAETMRRAEAHDEVARLAQDALRMETAMRDLHAGIAVGHEVSSRERLQQLVQDVPQLDGLLGEARGFLGEAHKFLETVGKLGSAMRAGAGQAQRALVAAREAADAAAARAAEAKTAFKAKMDVLSVYKVRPLRTQPAPRCQFIISLSESVWSPAEWPEEKQ